MNLKKNIAILILCLLTAFSLVPGISFAGELPSDGDYTENTFRVTDAVDLAEDMEESIEETDAADETEIPEYPESSDVFEEPEENCVPNAEDPLKAGPSYLFIGNSKTYYNNLPEMYAALVKAGTGEELNLTSVLYASRSEEEHSFAFNAVARTGGDPDLLTESEKAYFTKKGVTEGAAFKKEIFNAYKNAVYDGDGNARHYDYIILQLYARPVDVGISRNAVLSILNILCDEDTIVILHRPYYQYTSSATPLTLAKEQSRLDASTEELCQWVRMFVSTKDVRVAYTGKAACDYFLYYGVNRAKKEFPDFYSVYLLMDGKKAANDLHIGDRVHMTQLGTYLFACVLYSAVYGEDASLTVHDYQAVVSTSACNLSSLKKALNYAAASGPLPPEVLWRAARAAYETQNGTWMLPLDTPVISGISNVKKGVKVEWSAVSGAEKYRVFRRTADSTWIALSDTEKLFFTDTSAESGKKYYYTVVCVSADSYGTLSEQSKEKSISYLAAPSLKNAKNTKNGIKVRWREVSGAHHYLVYRKTSSSEWKQIGSVQKLSYVDKTVAPNVFYTYAVRAVNKKGKIQSALRTGKKRLFLRNTAVTSALSGKHKLFVSWEKAADQVTGYQIQYSTKKNFNTVKQLTVKGKRKVARKINVPQGGKKFFVRIRTYRKVAGKVYYSAWSKKYQAMTQ